MGVPSVVGGTPSLCAGVPVSKQSGRQSPETNRAEQAGYYEHRARVMSLGDRPCDLDDARAVRERCDMFFRLCMEDGAKPTLPGLALALGTDAAGMAAHTTRELQRAVMCVEDIVTQMALDGRAAMAPAIFVAKNWFGYEDSPRRQSSLADSPDRAELERRYRNVELADGGDGKGQAR